MKGVEATPFIKVIKIIRSIFLIFIIYTSKLGRVTAQNERADFIVKFNKEYTYNENSDLRESTFKQYSDLYLEYRSKGGDMVSGNTTLNYLTAFNRFEALNNIKMKDITLVRIETIAYKIIDDGRKSSTVRAYLKLLNCMFRRASGMHKIIEPLNINGIKLKPQIKKQKEALTIEQGELVLSKFKVAKNKQYYLLMYLAIKLGMRIGEVLGLTWDNIDLETQMIKINTQFKNVGKEGNKKRFYAYSEILKTENSIREIYVSKKVIQELKAHKLITPPKPLVEILNEKKRLFQCKKVYSLLNNQLLLELCVVKC